MSTKPIMYLDIDDTLLIWDGSVYNGFAPKYAPDFLLWAAKHFEVRWLTCWFMGGYSSEYFREKLATILFDPRITPDFFLSFDNPRSHDCTNKLTAIDFDTDREWVWVEDSCSPDERAVLARRKVYDNFYPTFTSEDHEALRNTWRLLSERFGFPMEDL